MPLGKSHWRPWGRYILYYAGSYQTGNDLQLRLFDPIAQSDVWKLDLDAKFKAHFFAQNEFAIIQRNGTFGIYDAATGKPKFETEVEVDPTLSPPRVFKGRDHYILATNHDDQPYFMKLQRAKIYLRMPQQGYPLPNAYGLNGHVYAFDFQGKAIWKNPIKVNQFSLLAPFPVDGPVLAFLREVTRRKPAAQNGRNTSEIVTEIVVVDRRTGQKVWETTRTNQRPQFSYLETKAAADQIVLTIPGIQRTTFTVTNDSADDVEDKPLVLARIPLPDTPKGNGKPK